MSAITLVNAAEDVRRPTNIPAQGLGAALNMLARDRGVQVVYRSDLIDGLRTDGAIGDFTTDEAVLQLLAGTRLTCRYIDERTLTIIPRPKSTEPPGATRSEPSSCREEVLPPQSPPVRPATSDSRHLARSPFESPVPLESVIVTAQKQTERLQDVPVAVTVIDATTAAREDRVLIADYAFLVPGMSVSPSPGASGQQQLAIRGISNGFNTYPTVGIVIDDVLVGSATSDVVYDIDPSNLERIEVLRGPQGTLYGASSIGGLLKLVTADPSTRGAFGRAEAQSNVVYNGAEPGYGVRAFINAPVSDTLALRLSGFTRLDAGYIDNPVLHVNGLNADHASGGLVTALWEPSSVYSLKLNALVQSLRSGGLSEANVWSLGAPLAKLADLQQAYLLGVGGYSRRLEFFSATQQATLSGIRLTSVTGYNIGRYSNSTDASYEFSDLFRRLFGVTGAGLVTTGHTDKISQEIRATVPAGREAQWLLGVYYAHERSLLTQDLLALDSATGASMADAQHNPQPYGLTEYALFNNVTVHCTDRLKLEIGGRETRTTVTNSTTTYSGAGSLGASSSILGTRSSSDAFTYLLTPRLNLSQSLMLYVRLASGYRVGGPNTVFAPGTPLYDPAEPHGFRPDKTQSYEIGVKGGLADHALSFDASAYHIDWKNIQIDMQDLNNLTNFTTNGSRAASTGAELNIESEPMMGLTLGAWVAYDDAVLTAALPAHSITYGVSGDRLPYSSRLSSKLSAQARFPLMHDLSGRWGITIGYVGSRLGTFTASPQRTTYPAYTRTDLHAGIEYRAWTADLFVNNATDVRGILGGGLGTYPPYAFTYIQPRTVGLSVSRAF